MHQGDLLAEIDPRPFQVQLMQAEGQKAKDEATLENAKVDLARYVILVQEDSIPKQQLDTQAATVNQLEASVKSDQGQIESAKLNLTYSRITAPDHRNDRPAAGRRRQHGARHRPERSGRHHAAPADHGRLHDPGRPAPAGAAADQAGNAPPGRRLRPRPEEQARDGLRSWRSTTRSTRRPGPSSSRRSSPTRTGLFPNQFVNARLLVDTLRGAVIVPTAAIQRSPQSTFVYVVKPDSTVEMRTVEVQLTEGDDTAIRKGDLCRRDGRDRRRRQAAARHEGRSGRGRSGRRISRAASSRRAGRERRARARKRAQ